MWAATSVGRASKNFDTREVSGKDGSRVFFALGGERFYAFERVGQAHAFVFEGAHGMIGEDFDAFDDGIGFEVLGQGVEACVVVCDAGNDDVAQPHGFTDLLQVVEKTRIVVARDTNVVFMNGVVDGFHVEENEVGGGEPLMQAEFVEAFFNLCRAEGIHTALDTAGSVWTEAARRRCR